MHEEKNAEQRALAVEVGKRIKRARDRAGLSQLALAEAIESRQQTIALYEVGRVLPGVQAVLRIAKATETQVADLVPLDAVKTLEPFPA